MTCEAIRRLNPSNCEQAGSGAQSDEGGGVEQQQRRREQGTAGANAGSPRPRAALPYVAARASHSACRNPMPAHGAVIPLPTWPEPSPPGSAAIDHYHQQRRRWRLWLRAPLLRPERVQRV